MDAMKKVLFLAAVSEAATGLALLVVPSLVGWLLLDEELTGIAIPVARVAGISLIALGIGCLPGSDRASSAARPFRAMLCYSLLATLYLAYLGIRGEWVGILLWPAVLVHAILTTFLVRSWLKDRQTRG
jgi:hypothetical protein